MWLNRVLLREFPSLRRRAAFWWLASEVMAVAVLARTRHEPQLEACAVSRRPQSWTSGSFAPGFLELLHAVDGVRLCHVAALGSEFVQLVTSEGSNSAVVLAPEVGCEIGLDPLKVSVRGEPDMTALARRTAVSEALNLFGAAGIELLELDAEPCARLAVCAALGQPRDSRGNALDAIAVAPDLAQHAGEFDDSLTVPIGLALARWGDPALLNEFPAAR
jgi:hypothetical protein